ncbi:thiopurine S-methyltransferase [Mesobaculum littorinae]|uniref:Thiopurine S-methyltransferase n=1 Tax=Mesobaculum littorinae TaxID=2486419 RepID=A0A438AKG8_9RHOB|nr:thiopurine S-methyltransferase [Mesobaculum littorinae]RVV99182.1 thiopurine S-methyltransferase [Mesobaculum littorinae]
MDANFWHDRWQKGQTGFHEGRANGLLTRHWEAIGLPPGATVLVPLCGKSVDMWWLRDRGARVIGAELSEKAVARFFDEAGVTPTRVPAGALTRWEGDGVAILEGDVFDLDARTLGPVGAVYDRAALVALPQPLRRRYAAHIAGITGAAPQMLITFAYDQAAMDGPPFSVDAAEVAACHGGTYACAALETRDVAGGFRGRVAASETLWHLTRPADGAAP